MGADTLASRATAFLQTLPPTAEPTGRIRYDQARTHERREAFLAGLRSLRGMGGQLQLGEILGAGAMGVVRLAVQQSVVRDVAVKSLRIPDVARPVQEGTPMSPAAERLLEEAWITGTIEHPNVVPVYDIGLDNDGSPLIVMRRIAGRSWGNTLADGNDKGRVGDEAWLESNLRILGQVANAVAAAHAQGIVHRDLKPENVMLGQYGEVYLVDWGIAVSVEPEKHPHLPVLGPERSVVGTPCYMAPEMLAGDATYATDVYLLGAIAFELATGTPPHLKRTMESAIMSILESPPPMPIELDTGLASLLRKALANDPADRFPSAHAFAEALEHHLLTRASVRTAQEGMAELALLEGVVADTSTADAAVSARVEALLGTTSFSFQSALRQWNENPVARSGLVTAQLLATRFALRNDDPERARTFLQNVPAFARDAESVRTLEKEVERAAEARRERLASLKGRGDVVSGQVSRNFITCCLAFLWSAFLGWGWWHVHERQSAFPRELLAATIFQTTVWTLLSLWARRSLKTEFNLSLVRLGLVIPAFLAALAILLELAGYKNEQISQIGLVALCGFLLSLSLFVGKLSQFVATGALCVATGGVVLRPEWRYAIAFFATSVLFVLLVGVTLRSKQLRDQRVSQRSA